MPWFNVDDGFAFHRKAVLAGNAAIGLWTRAGSWCAKELTDGFVPDHMVPTMGTRHQADKLVTAGLWVRDDARGGYQFHQYSEDGRNPKRADVLKKREQAADKKRRQREQNGHESRSPEVVDLCPGGTSAVVPPVVPGGVNASPPLPSLTTKRTRRQGGPQAHSYTAEFEQFWQAYPKRNGSKGSKFEASKVWAKAITLTSIEDLLSSVKRYADSPQARDGFAKDAATWLRKRCWEEDTSPEPATDVAVWLRGEWRAGRVRVIEERTGMRYPQPDIPLDLEPADVEPWLIRRCQQWIAENHDVILERLTGRRSA